jgi:predicted nucleotidyltransferase
MTISSTETGNPEWLREIESWAEQRNEVSEVWLFGSRAKGSARDDSDMDLALILDVFLHKPAGTR